MIKKSSVYSLFVLCFLFWLLLEIKIKKRKIEMNNLRSESSPSLPVFFVCLFFFGAQVKSFLFGFCISARESLEREVLEKLNLK